MPNVDAAQLQEITYLTGVDANGVMAPDTHWTWSQALNHDTFPYTAKWGDDRAGTGAVVSVYYDTNSHWSAAELRGLNASAQLWSAVANIRFVTTTDAGSADVMVYRGDDGFAQGGIDSLDPGRLGTKQLGVADTGFISIDTSVRGFGPIDLSFATAGGYVWQVMVHEWGHVVGLGHGGNYDVSQGDDTPQHGPYDSRAWTVMSYIDAGDPDFPDTATPTGGFIWGRTGTPLRGTFLNVETTWMPLDILAAQRCTALPWILRYPAADRYSASTAISAATSTTSSTSP